MNIPIDQAKFAILTHEQLDHLTEVAKGAAIYGAQAQVHADVLFALMNAVPFQQIQSIVHQQEDHAQRQAQVQARQEQEQEQFARWREDQEKAAGKVMSRDRAVPRV